MQAWVTSPARPADVDNEAGWFQEAMSDICDVRRYQVPSISSWARDLAHEEIMGTLDRDPWGRLYKMVRDKLRPWAPPH